MESRIAIINGPAGVGKTTVSRILATYGHNSACIHGDDFAGYIVNRDLKAVASGLGYKNGATVANNFIKGGYDLVVYDYVFEDHTHLPKFINHLAASGVAYFFTLWASLDRVTQREAARLGRDPLGHRVRTCYRTMAQSLDTLGTIIDTDDKSPEAVAAEIWALMLARKGVVAS